MATDRRAYYREYNKKHGDRHRKGYYRDYNKAHPERLNRGYTKGYVGGCVSSHTLESHLTRKEHEWHDDDWVDGIMI